MYIYGHDIWWDIWWDILWFNKYWKQQMKSKFEIFWKTKLLRTQLYVDDFDNNNDTARTDSAINWAFKCFNINNDLFLKYLNIRNIQRRLESVNNRGGGLYHHQASYFKGFQALKISGNRRYWNTQRIFFVSCK